MKTTHPVKPWSYVQDYDNSWMQPIFRIDAEHEEIATVWSLTPSGQDMTLAESVAKRIVECVNACEGVPSEILTSLNKDNELFFEHLELEIKYQKLKEVVQTLKSVVDDRGSCQLTRDSLLFLALQEGSK
jgi:hypothetical protein